MILDSVTASRAKQTIDSYYCKAKATSKKESLEAINVLGNKKSSSQKPSKTLIDIAITQPGEVTKESTIFQNYLLITSGIK